MSALYAKTRGNLPYRIEIRNRWGFGNPRTLAKYRKEVLEHGLLNQVRMPQYGQNSETRKCGLYKLGEPTFYGKTYHKKT